MIKHPTLIPVGDSLGIVIPDDVLTRLQLKPGDTVLLEESTGVLKLTAAGPEFERQMAIARDVMDRNWNVLRELANSPVDHRAP